LNVWAEDPEPFKVFAEEFVKESNRLRGLEQGRADLLRQDLARVERRLNKLVDAIADGLSSAGAEGRPGWWPRARRGGC
jgi:hypothetical protein